MPKGIRLPFASIEAAVRCDIADPERRSTPSQSDWARRLHVHNKEIARWRQNGLTIERADYIAVKILGVHPCFIWPEWFDLPT